MAQGFDSENSVLTGEAENITRPLDDSELEAETDAQEGDLLFSRPFDREKHPLSATFSESAGDEYTPTVLCSSYPC